MEPLLSVCIISYSNIISIFLGKQKSKNYARWPCNFPQGPSFPSPSLCTQCLNWGILRRKTGFIHQISKQHKQKKPTKIHQLQNKTNTTPKTNPFPYGELRMQLVAVVGDLSLCARLCTVCESSMGWMGTGPIQSYSGRERYYAIF